MLSALAEAAGRHGSRPFLIDPAGGRAYSYRETWEASAAVAARLRREGVRAGDRVVVLLGNEPRYVTVSLALMLLGASAVPLAPTTPPRELEAIVEEAAPRCAVAVDARADCGRRTAPAGCPVWLVDDGLACGADAGDRLPAAAASDPDDLVVLYTSGTTSGPKGVVLTAERVLANFREYGERMGFGPDTRFLQPMPVAHADGWNFTLLVPFLHGASVVLVKPSVPQLCARFTRLVAGQGANVLVGVPSILSALVRSAHRYRDPAGLACAISSSETLQPRLKRGFEAAFRAPVYDLYGLTETQIVSYYAADVPWRAGSVGRLQRGVELRRGPDGELQVRSPYLFDRYLAQPQTTRASWDGDWFRTRDRGRIDADGYLFLEGRLDATIRRGGVAVSPATVDAVLAGHPAVSEAATIGVDDGLGVAAICSFVAAERSSERLAAALRRLCEAQLEPAARPTRVVFLDSLPRTAVGKVDGAALRRLAAERHASAAAPEPQAVGA